MPVLVVATRVQAEVILNSYSNITTDEKRN